MMPRPNRPPTPIPIPLLALLATILITVLGPSCRSTETSDPTEPGEPDPVPAARPLRPVPFDEIFSEFRVFETFNPMIEVWQLHGDVAVARNTSDEESYFLIGFDEWQDYVVELEALFPTDRPLRLGVSSAVIGESLEFGMLRLASRHEEWHRLRIEVEGAHVRVIDLDDDEVFVDEATPYPQGGLAFHVPPGEQIALRNIRVRVDRELPFVSPDVDSSSGEPSEDDDGQH